MVASWDAPIDKNGKTQADIVAYQAQWKRGDNEWINIPETGLRNIEVSGIYSGDYLVRVRAINSGGASSLWATSALTHLTGRTGEVPKPIDFVPLQSTGVFRLTGPSRLIQVTRYRLSCSIQQTVMGIILCCLPEFRILNTHIPNWV